MEGGELFNRIQERTAFNERGNLNIYIENSSVSSNKYFYRSSGDREGYLYCCQVPP